MVGGGDLKVATVEVESVDNMATLPVGRAHGGSDTIAEKNNVANKEMELKNVQPKPAKRSVTICQASILHCLPNFAILGMRILLTMELVLSNYMYFNISFSLSQQYNYVPKK